MVNNTHERADDLEAQASQEPVEFKIETAEQFYNLMREWFIHKFAVLEHMRTIPEGTVIEDTEGVKHDLSGAFLEGFKAGIDVALIEFQEMPFNIYSEEAEQSAGVDA